MIYKRKSHRKYSDKKLTEEDINKIIEFSKTLKSLNKNIKTDIKIVIFSNKFKTLLTFRLFKV